MMSQSNFSFKNTHLRKKLKVRFYWYTLMNTNVTKDPLLLEYKIQSKRLLITIRIIHHRINSCNKYVKKLAKSLLLK